MPSGETDTAELDCTLWVPSLAVKGYLARPAASTVAPYLYAAIFTMVPSASGDTGLDDVLDDTWNFGGSVAFGAEYFFHRQFSVGGEFGLNLLFGGYEEGGDEYSGDLEATYAALTLNFRFGGTSGSGDSRHERSEPARRREAAPTPPEKEGDDLFYKDF